MSLLPHNLETLKAIQRGLSKSKKICYIQATSTGKGYVAAALISKLSKENPSDRFLYITSHNPAKKETCQLLKKIAPLADFDIELYSNLSKNNYCSLQSNVVVI